MNLPCFIDLEASGLHITESYPIQVAWSLADARIECWLIKPAADWRHWDAEVELLHGLCREELVEFGALPDSIAARMNAQLAGQTVFCDGGTWDRFWIRRLFESAGLALRFEVGDVATLWHSLAPGLFPNIELTGYNSERFFAIECKQEELRSIARSRAGGQRHRADNDVRYLMELHTLVASLSGANHRT